MSTYSQIYIQIVFAVKGRASVIHETWENELFKYISGIVRNRDQKMLAIQGMPDHIHFLIGMRPSCCLADLVREVKKSSNEYVNSRQFGIGRFSWQEGYGAFSYNHRELDTIISYIMNQKAHHRRNSFRAEYLELLKSRQIIFEDKYLFEWYD